MTELQLDTDLRCVVQTAALGEQPAGTAGFARRVVLVELPLPWPKKIDRHPLLAEADLGTDPNVKLLGVGTTDAIPSDRHRVICWERTEPFRGYERTETVVERRELGALVEAVATVGPSAIEDPASVDPGTQDLLICTHGTRDRCCGQLGIRLHSALADVLGPDVRLWRTSHTGGHRFAPTGIHFPDGTTWSTLTAELTVGIVGRSVATDRLTPHFRGNLGVAGRPEQIAEGATFLDRGWDWLTAERSVDIEPRSATSDMSSGLITATVRSAESSTTVTMHEGAAIPVPACGEDLEAATKATPQFRIV